MAEINSISTQNQHKICELKPCPFCGGKNIDLIERCITVVFVQCDDCYATFPHFDSKEEAINAWNTRTPQKEGVRV